MERLDVVKFRIFAGAVPMIKEIIVLVDDRACDKQHYGRP